MRRGELFILSAPSGSGKTTLIQNLIHDQLAGFDGIAFSVSYTTRSPRAGEVDGVHYHFTSRPSFVSMIDRDEFLEWAEVHGCYYGTASQEVLPRLDAGMDVILDIDVKGAEQVMERCPEAHGIFIMPPTYEDLERRLNQRGLNDPQEISRRLAASREEIRRYDRYHYVIINDDARRASHILASIVLEKRHRLAVMEPRAAEIVRNFETAAHRASSRV